MSWRSIALGAAAFVAGGGIALLAVRKSAATTAESRTPDTKKEKLSYAMGVAMATSIERQSSDLEADFVARGLNDQLTHAKLLMSDSDLREAIVALDGELKKRQAASKSEAEENQKRGEAFLVENSKKDGVVTLPSGLQYRVIKAGGGRKATDRDTVQCHYRSMRIDGTEVDNTYKRARPAMFQVARAMPGWREALKLMPAGSKWTLYVPSALAFGQRGLRPKRGMPPAIGPNTPVVFELELLAINPGTQAAADAPAQAREN